MNTSDTRAEGISMQGTSNRFSTEAGFKRQTENNLIFIEKDEPLPMSEIDAKLEKLEKAVYDPSLTNEEVRSVLREVVPTYRRPEDVNREYAEKQKKEA